MKKKSLLISESTHTRLKNYCDGECIKLNDWVDKLIQKELDAKTKK